LLIIKKAIDRILFKLYFHGKYKKDFKNYGENIRWGRNFGFLIIPKSVRLSCPEKIEIGNDCEIDENVYLQCHFKGEGIVIGEGSRINAHTHIQAFSKITLGAKVLIAPFAMLNSGDHGYGESGAIMDQEYIASGEILIGEGSWIARGSQVLGNCSLAPRTVVAAGAVVTKSSEGSCILAGVPARNIRDLT